MPTSNDSVVFGYDDFHTAYHDVPYICALLELSAAQLIHPSTFDSHNPHHVCLAALHGHLIYPFDDQRIKERVQNNAAYSKTVAARMDKFKTIVSEFNTRHQRLGFFPAG